MCPAGIEKMPGFLPAEGHRQIGRHRRSANRATRTVDPGRDVDRHDRNARRVHGGDELRVQSFDVPREAGADKGIDNERRSVEHWRSPRLYGTGPLIRHPACVAREKSPVGSEADADRPARGLKEPRDHEAVAAVVAGPAQNGCRAWRPALRDLLRDGTSGILHEDMARYPAIDRQAIDRSHLLGREKF